MNDEQKSAEQILSERGTLVSTTFGVSMYPLLRDHMDIVQIIPPDEIKKNDVVLFRRGKQLVLHRVIKVRENCFFIRGDNCMRGETVKREQIIGILNSFTRRGRQHSVSDPIYKIYSFIFVHIHPVPVIVFRTFFKLKRLFAANKTEQE